MVAPNLIHIKMRDSFHLERTHSLAALQLIGQVSRAQVRAIARSVGIVFPPARATVDQTGTNPCTRLRVRDVDAEAAGPVCDRTHCGAS
jgi:hypothetical protein